MRGNVSYGRCKYSLEESAKETVGEGEVTLLNPDCLPLYPDQVTGYTLELDDGTLLSSELWGYPDRDLQEHGSTHRYVVRCWPKEGD